MKLVYVAGPFRGKTEWSRQQNVRAAETAGLEICRLGAMAVIPHKNTEHFDGELPDEFFLNGTMALLERCDAIYLLPTWQSSAGARAELKQAKFLGTPQFYDLDSLKTWLAQNT